jgi:hypothetical protein
MVDTEAKKLANFKRGLNPKMMKAMGNNSRETFQAFVQDCLNQEANNLLYSASKNKKRDFEGGSSQNSGGQFARRQNYRAPAAPSRYAPPQRRFPSGSQRFKKAFVTPVQKGKPPQGNVSRTAPPHSNCYNCGKPGHFSKYCPQPRRTFKQHVGQAHFTSAEETPEGETVTAGTCLVNNSKAVVLFDSGSTHSFMSQAFAKKNNTKIDELGYGYRISSAGADQLTR